MRRRVMPSLCVLLLAGGCGSDDKASDGDVPVDSGPSMNPASGGSGGYVMTGRGGASTGGTGARPGDSGDAGTDATDASSAVSDAGPDADASSPALDAGAASDAGVDSDASGPTDDAGVVVGPKTPYPGQRWTPPDPTYGSMMETGVQIQMSDGVILIGDVWYPTDLVTGQRASGGFPVILTQNPYGAGFQGLLPTELFVTHGYIYAAIEVRGTGRSQGVHDMFAPREAEDGAALVTWAANLPGSDGRVGLHGCSQLGINQLETVTQLGANSPVKAMIPACGSGDFYRDTAFDNGVPTAVATFLPIWAEASTGGDTAYYRDYWRERDRVARAPAMAATGIPMLLWSGWHEPGALGSAMAVSSVHCDESISKSPGWTRRACRFAPISLSTRMSRSHRECRCCSMCRSGRRCGPSNRGIASS